MMCPRNALHGGESSVGVLGEPLTKHVFLLEPLAVDRCTWKRKSAPSLPAKSLVRRGVNIALLAFHFA
jgi:hypothetical protein